MYCHSCGSPISPSDTFCTRCGQPVAQPTAGAIQEWTPTRPASAHIGHWLGEGWRLMDGHIGLFMLLTLVFIILGAVVPIVLQGPLAVGMHICFIKKIRGRNPEFADLFQGFNYFV